MSPHGPGNLLPLDVLDESGLPPVHRPRPGRDRLLPVLLFAFCLLTAWVAWRLIARPTEATSFESRFGEALLALDAGRRDDATRALRELATPTDAPLPVLVTLARLAHEDGRLDETRALLDRAINRAPETPDLHLWRALLALEQADPTRAREALKTARHAGASALTRARLEALLDRPAP